MQKYKPTADQLIPPEVWARLAAQGDTGDESCYSIGDEAAAAVDELCVTSDGNRRKVRWVDQATGEVTYYPMGLLWSAIGQACGRSAATVRDYERYSRLITPGLRKRYDMLGRHHHKAIADYAKGDEQEHARLCDDWLAKADDYGGTVGPVDALRVWLKHPNGLPEMWGVWLDRMTSYGDKILEEGKAAPGAMAAVRESIKLLEPHIPKAKPAGGDTAPLAEQIAARRAGGS